MTETTADSFADLRRAMSGVVATPGEAGYDEAVNVWNGSIAPSNDPSTFL